MKACCSTGSQQHAELRRSTFASSSQRRSGLVVTCALPPWVDKLKQRLTSLSHRQDRERTDRRSGPGRPRQGGVRKPRPSLLQAITTVQVADDLTVLVDVKRQRLVYVVCAEDPSNAQKIIKLLKLTSAKLVWIVSEQHKEHAPLAQKLMSSVPCSAWEINVAHDSFHPAQLAMLEARVAPGPSDGITMPLQRLIARRDRPDRVVGRMRRYPEDPLTYCYMRELRFKKQKALASGSQGGPRKQKRKYAMLQSLLLQPHMFTVTDGIMLARNRDLEVAWHTLTNFNLGPYLGRTGRDLGFLKPYPMPYPGEQLTDSDYQGFEVDDVWQAPSTTLLHDSSFVPRQASDDTETADVEAEGVIDVELASVISSDSESEGEEEDAEAARDVTPVPDPSVPYAAISDIQREREMARQRLGQQGVSHQASQEVSGSEAPNRGFELLAEAAEHWNGKQGLDKESLAEFLGPNWEAELAALDIQITDMEGNPVDLPTASASSSAAADAHPAGSPSSSSSSTAAVADAAQLSADGACSPTEFVEMLAKYSERQNLSDDELAELMDSHRVLLEQGLVADSVSSGSLTLTTNSDGQGIIIQHDPRTSMDESNGGSGEAGADEEGREEEEEDAVESMVQQLHPMLGHPSASDYDTVGGFNCQLMHLTNRPNDMAVVIRVEDDGTAGPGGVVRPSPGEGAGLAANKAFLELCYQGVSNYTLDVIPSISQDATTDTDSQPSSSQSATAQSSQSQPAAYSSKRGTHTVRHTPRARRKPTQASQPSDDAAQPVDQSPEPVSSAPPQGSQQHVGSVAARADQTQGKQEEQATNLARDLLGRDVSTQEAEELAAALLEAASAFDEPQSPVSQPSDSQPAPSSQPPTSATPSAKAASADGKEDSHGEDRPGSGAGVAVGGGRRVAKPGDDAGKGSSDAATAATEAESSSAASAAAAVDGTRVTIDDLVATLHEKMNAAFGVQKTSKGGRKAQHSKSSTPTVRHPVSPRRAGRVPLPGSRARSLKVKTVSRLRGLADGWLEHKADATPARPWGTGWGRGQGRVEIPTITPEPEGSVTFMQAARTVARVMELLHRPCDGATSFTGQDVVVVLPGHAQRDASAPHPATPSTGPHQDHFQLIVVDDKVVEFDSDVLGAFGSLSGGDGGGQEDEEELLPLEVVAKNISAVWNQWEQELMAPGVQAVEVTADAYLESK